MDLVCRRPGRSAGVDPPGGVGPAVAGGVPPGGVAGVGPAGVAGSGPAGVAGVSGERNLKLRGVAGPPPPSNPWVRAC